MSKTDRSAEHDREFEPSMTLAELQAAYARLCLSRGWDEENIQDTMLLLTEEVGELARAVRKEIGLGRDRGYEDDVAEELADVFMYVMQLSNLLNIDLAQALQTKVKQLDERNPARSL